MNGWQSRAVCFMKFKRWNDEDSATDVISQKGWFSTELFIVGSIKDGMSETSTRPFIRMVNSAQSCLSWEVQSWKAGDSMTMHFLTKWLIQRDAAHLIRTYSANPSLDSVRGWGSVKLAFLAYWISGHGSDCAAQSCQFRETPNGVWSSYLVHQASV